MDTHNAAVALVDASDVRFQLSRSSHNLLLSRSEEPAPFNLTAQSPSHSRKVSKQAPRALPLASCTMSQLQGSNSSTGTAPMPLFMIASAAESKPAQPSSAPAWRIMVGNLLAGATAGCAVEAALYPIDTIKTRLQAMIGGGGLKALIEKGGGRGLYAGVWGNLAGVAPASALFMAVYEPVKQATYRNFTEDQHYLAPILAGAAAGAVSSLVRVPTEVIKQRLQTGEFKSAVTAVRTIMAREGMRGLYSGYFAFMLRDLPFDAIEFFSYEQAKIVYSRTVKRELNPLEQSIIGAFAGGFTGVITTPLDVLKTRLMTQGASGMYRNLFDCAAQIAQKEGMGAFMKGWQPRLIWISLGGFVFFPVLEAAKKAYAPKEPEKPVLEMTPLVVEEPAKDKKKKK